MTSPSRPRQIASMPSASPSETNGAVVMIVAEERTVLAGELVAEPTAVVKHAVLDASGLTWSAKAGMLSKMS